MSIGEGLECKGGMELKGEVIGEGQTRMGFYLDFKGR
jgi:hypothetical protein